MLHLTAVILAGMVPMLKQLYQFAQWWIEEKDHAKTQRRKGKEGRKEGRKKEK